MKKSVTIIVGTILIMAAEPPPPIVSGLDFAVDWRNYLGKVVTVTDGYIEGANVDRLFLEIPGSHAVIRTERIPPVIMKYLIKNCNYRPHLEACEVSVTGLVGKDAFGTKPALTNVVLAPSRGDSH